MTSQRHNFIGYNYRLPEIASAVALAEMERAEKLVEMRQACAARFAPIAADCDWLVPQKTPDDCIHGYWVYAAWIARDELDWMAFRRKFVELGRDGFYGAYLPVPREPVFGMLNEQVQAHSERYPHHARRLQDYRKVSCPVWEKIQPRVIQLKKD